MMGEDSKISWTNDTFNPWIGCTKLSPACSHCYAEEWAKRYGQADWGPEAERVITSDANWNKPIRWNKMAQASGERRRVFCASLADVFEGRSELDSRRERLWKLIAKTPFLDWLLLTKRPENILNMVPTEWKTGAWPLNVWAGTTFENQEWAEKRVFHLLPVPAPILFVSCEPLLGDLDLSRVKHPSGDLVDVLLGERYSKESGCIVSEDEPRLSWVIVGGESGEKFRPMKQEWVRKIQKDCAVAGTPFFYKQESGVRPNKEPTLDGKRFIEIPVSKAS